MTITTELHRGQVFLAPVSQWRETIRYTCSCGFETAQHFNRYAHFAEHELREHLAAVHAAELGIGPCAECGRPTDYLRAGDMFLCADHAPTPEQWAIATGTETE